MLVQFFSKIFYLQLEIKKKKTLLQLPPVEHFQFPQFPLNEMLTRITIILKVFSLAPYLMLEYLTADVLFLLIFIHSKTAFYYCQIKCRWFQCRSHNLHQVSFLITMLSGAFISNCWSQESLALSLWLISSFHKPLFPLKGWNTEIITKWPPLYHHNHYPFAFVITRITVSNTHP